jgi:hypothetical protein
VHHAKENTGHTTQFYEGQVPPFTEDTLETLYGSLYSSLPQLSLDGLGKVSTYAATNNGHCSALFLYTRQPNAIRVVNEGMMVKAGDAQRFAQQVFARDAKVSKVHFHAIRLTGSTSSLLSLHLPVTEDIVIDLPNDEASYVASLGKSTRKTLRQNQARAGSISHQLIGGADVDVAVIDTIIGFNHARMAKKHRQSALDAQSRAQLLKLLRARGMVSTVCIDGSLSAGTLACRFGDDVFSLVNAHDPAVDHLGMGNLSRHLMILDAIRLGARSFHLLGGHFASKRSCGAQRIPLVDVTLYRNRFAMMTDIAGVIDLILRSASYQIRIALDDPHNTQTISRTARLASRCVRLLREVKQGLRALTIARR